MVGPFIRRSCVLAAAIAIAVNAFAGLAPVNTAVVVNGDSWASLTVANEYARLRGVPPGNFVVLHGLSNIESVDVDRFRMEVLVPVFTVLRQRGILKQIDCIAYSVDVPYSVQVGSDMSGKKFPQVITGTAATNGLTYLHEWVEKKDTDYLSLDINRYDRRQLPLPTGAPLNAEERAQYSAAMSLYTEKKYAEAAVGLQKILAANRSDAGVAYDLSCCLSLCGCPEDAIVALRKAVAAGFRSAGQAEADPDFRSLAGREDFQQILRTMRSARVAVQPGCGFRSRYAWDVAGQAGPSGPHYMLSTMLGVTSGRGNSVNEVLDCLRRAAAADFSAPKGTIYFPKNGDVRSTTREWGYLATAGALEKAGVHAVVESGVLPNNRSDVAGAMLGAAGFDWPASKSTILPGAICEHLTSFGGIIGERAGQTPCTDLIRAGAAGSSGTVTEPFAIQAKFPTPFIQLQYALGWTLAEAFYQSLYGPYQLLIIGDPMCRPWAKPLKVSVPGIAPGAALKGQVSVKPSASRPGDVAAFELYIDGRYLSEAKLGTAQKIDTRLSADGYHTLEVVAVEKGPVEARTSLSVPFSVTNQAPHNITTSLARPRVDLGERATIGLSCKGATAIELMHLGRSVARLTGDHGSLRLDTALLGLGRALLQPLARVGGKTVCGKPFALQVEPSPIEPVAAEPNAAKSPGLSLVMANGPRWVVRDTMDAGWLAKLAPGPAQAFTLTGWFSVPKADLYQVQVTTNTGASVEISGVKVLTAKDASQHLAGVFLKAGTHRLVLRGVAPAGALLDVRLGAAGAYHLAEGQFKH